MSQQRGGQRAIAFEHRHGPGDRYGAHHRFLGCQRIAMVSIRKQRSLGQDRSGAGTLQRQLESVRKCPNKAQFSRGDQEERQHRVVHMKQGAAGRERLLASREFKQSLEEEFRHDRNHVSGPAVGVKRCKTRNAGDRSMNRIAVLSLMLVFLAVPHGLAQQHGDLSRHKAAAEKDETTSSYSGMEARRVKALSGEQIADLMAGRGMGLALAAELNSYPGPSHRPPGCSWPHR
ncbi:hypothetical protein NKH11_02460 [Mesorhizobium sp. M1393]